MEFIKTKWGKKMPDAADANIRVLKAGYFFGETVESSRNRYMVARAEVEPGTYRKISGNEAIALGLIAGARKAGRTMLFSGYPITPASSILEMLAEYKHFGVKTVQAEDEIAAIGIALGGSYAGCLGVTATSGPGMCLKSRIHGLGGVHRIAVGHHQRPAGRPEHRLAHQDRAVGPAAGALRSPRRGADAGGRRQLAVRLLPCRLRRGARWRSSIPRR